MIWNFPKDHGLHPEHRIEWWHYVGNLQSEAGERFGYQLTFFRKKVAGTHAFIAHFAISDISSGKYSQTEKRTRHASVVEADDVFSLCMKNCVMRIGKHHRLIAEADDFSIDLSMTGGIPILHGENGLSRKGTGPDKTSYYYSIPNLNTAGDLRIGDRYYEVSGASWMDHEFFSAHIESGIIGWDWFGLQLGGDTQLMLYKLRRKDGTYHPASSGTLIRNGIGRPVEDIRVTPLARNCVYPRSWSIWIPSEHISIEVSAAMPGQEFRSEFTGINYFEGAVTVSNSGTGYVELTGYDAPFKALSKRQGIKYFVRALIGR